MVVVDVAFNCFLAVSCMSGVDDLDFCTCGWLPRGNKDGGYNRITHRLTEDFFFV